MGLPQWCQTHSLKEFFQLMEDQPKKERNMTNVETLNTNGDVALEALNALNAAEANLADAVYTDNGSELKLATPASEVEAEQEAFVQEDPAEGVTLN